MSAQKTFLLSILFAVQSLCAQPLAEKFAEVGYVEIPNQKPVQETFDSLYASFDALCTFLQTNPAWAQKLYIAKERFIRTKGRNFYSTDFFGFYDDAERVGKRQIAFYYATHFHEFIRSNYPELIQAPEIIDFLDACYEIQKPYGDLFNAAAAELELESIFQKSDPPILLKVMKYLPSYIPTKPHYDGTAFSLFLDSTDNQSLLLSPYKSSLTVDDFSSPQREFPKSILLIPGMMLTEFSIYPTPHIVLQSGNVRYATIAFAMRANYIPQKVEISSLPNFSH